MGEVIEVFFKNENDAESAQAELQTLKVNKLYIEEMPKDMDTTIFVPFFPTTGDANTTGAGRGASPGPVAPIISELKENPAGPNYPNYLLHVEVETEDYDHVRSVLQEHDCYMRDE